MTNQLTIARPSCAGRGGEGRSLSLTGALCVALMLGACADVQTDESAGVVSQRLHEGEATSEHEVVASSEDEALAPAGINPVFPDTVFTDLDYGLYWYGYDAGSAAGRYQKADPSQNPFYDPARPTIIHIHGWQNGSIAEFSREDFDHGRGSKTRTDTKAGDIAKAWLDQGYNVGMLYWTNFADEGSVTDAEAKIWPASRTSIRYKVCKTLPKPGTKCQTESRNFSANATVTVSSLLTDSVIAGMPNFSGESLRLSGHSLGNQIAIAIAGDIHQRLQEGKISNHKLLPTRIALLDPYYSGAKTSNLGLGIMNTLKSNYLGTAPVVFEAYRSSAVAVQNSSVILKKGNAAIVSLRPSYYNVAAIAPKHQVAYWWYYWAKAFPVPAIGGGSSVRGLSSSASYDEVKLYMDSAQYLDQAQDAATGTTLPSDDVFKLVNR